MGSTPSACAPWASRLPSRGPLQRCHNRCDGCPTPWPHSLSVGSMPVFGLCICSPVWIGFCRKLIAIAEAVRVREHHLSCMHCEEELQAGHGAAALLRLAAGGVRGADPRARAAGHAAAGAAVGRVGAAAAGRHAAGDGGVRMVRPGRQPCRLRLHGGSAACAWGAAGRRARAHPKHAGAQRRAAGGGVGALRAAGDALLAPARCAAWVGCSARLHVGSMVARRDGCACWVCWTIGISLLGEIRGLRRSLAVPLRSAWPERI